MTFHFNDIKMHKNENRNKQKKTLIEQIIFFQMVCNILQKKTLSKINNKSKKNGGP